MGPYRKSQDSNAVDDGWTVCEGDGHIIAHVETEYLADVLLQVLLDIEGDARGARFPADEWLGEEEQAGEDCPQCGGPVSGLTGLCPVCDGEADAEEESAT